MQTNLVIATNSPLLTQEMDPYVNGKPSGNAMKSETNVEKELCHGTLTFDTAQEGNTGISKKHLDNSEPSMKSNDIEPCPQSSREQTNENGELDSASNDKELQEDYIDIVQELNVDESPEQSDQIGATAQQPDIQQTSSQLCETINQPKPTNDEVAKLSAKNLYITMCADDHPSLDERDGNNDSVYHKIDCIYDEYAAIDDNRGDLKNTTNSITRSRLNTLGFPCREGSFLKKGIIILLSAITIVCVVSLSIIFTRFGNGQPEESRENIGITLNFVNLK